MNVVDSNACSKRQEMGIYHPATKSHLTLIQAQYAWYAVINHHELVLIL